MPARPWLDVLHQLRAELGTPSYREITKKAQLRGHAGQGGTGIGRSTFSDLLLGRTSPRRETVEAFVVGCLAAGRSDGLDPEKRHAAYWLRAFDAATAAPPAVVDPVRFVDRPSQLLVTENEIVEFTGRVDELRRLSAWREGEARVSALWLHGPGGQGKTRLGRRFATDSAAAGWQVEASWGTTGQRGDLVVVVDYADRIPHTDLVALVDRHTDPRRRTRFLLLARSTSPWPALRHELSSRQATSAELSLPALASTVDDRARVFALARDSFARALGVSDAEGIIPPADLDHPDLGLALSLHMAALVAVDAHLRQVAPPTEPGDLSAYLLDREEAHWVRLLERPDFRTVPNAMRRTVFAACLIGARPYAEAAQALSFMPDAATVLMDHSYCYPAADHVLQPLLPDRLAEDFLALTLQAQPWATADLDALLARPADGSPPTGVDRAITFLAAASAPGRHPHVAAHLETLLLADPRLALDAGGAALTALTHLAPKALIAVANTFPARDINLDAGMFAVVESLLGRALEQADGIAKASMLVSLATRAWWAGAVERAVELCREATALARTLHDGPNDPVELAVMLTGTSQVLVAVGLADDAVEMAEAALRTLDHHAPSADSARAAALGALGQALTASIDRRAEALPVLRRAIAAFDEIRRHNPAAFETEQSAMHSLLAACLRDEGQARESEHHRREALESAARLAESNPAAHADRYASTLLIVADEHASTGDFSTAEALARQAVDIVRGHPVPHLPSLARCLVGLAKILDRVGEWERAAPVLDEAYELAVRLSADWSLAELLVGQLDDHAARLDEAGRAADELAVRRRAVELSRSMVERNPGTAHRLAHHLEQLGATLAPDGQLVEATSMLREAVTIREQQGDPELVARALGVLGAVRQAAGAPVAEVIGLLTRAVADHPGRHRVGGDRMAFMGALFGLLFALLRDDNCADAADLGERWVDAVAETADADHHVLWRATLAMALCLSDRVSAGVVQADRARALAADADVADTARATALHAFAMSRTFSGTDLDEALAANSECRALLTAETDLSNARQVRERLLELIDQNRT
ncbi:hypothetical protein [Kutzneria chonburiensis]|uniref:Tetratricopeptide repeat protein n=1 Tax=Kutzneria chonburiensis TaxID=1483604 RepID=A0ABV6MRR7_9PSEU|nr:hypothetical protein [Kutzneria chonburiensis]